MIFSIILHHTYKTVHVALCKDGIIMSHVHSSHKDASANMLSMIEQLLKDHTLSLKDIHFIGANRGPGPLTTLHALITTCNAIGYAQSIPLIGINGIQALVEENRSSKKTTIGLLNAFGGYVYFGIADMSDDLIVQTGCEPIQPFLDRLCATYKTGTPIYMIGNAVPLYAEQIEQRLQTLFSLELNTDVTHCSLAWIGSCAYQRWTTNTAIDDHISPLYMKKTYTYSRAP